MRKMWMLLIGVMLLGGCAGMPASVLNISQSGPDGGKGTAFAVAETADSYILATAAHCVEASTPVIIEGVICTDIKTDVDADVAVIRMPKQEGRQFRVWGLGDAVAGHPVMSIGLVYVNAETQTVRFPGVIVSENWTGCVAVAGSVYPGMSGGPLVDLTTGKVVGVTSRAESVFGGMPDMGLSLYAPSAVVRRLLDEMDKGG